MGDSLPLTPEDTGVIKFKVSGNVINHLSKGLYRSFPRAIKELISNSYDAGSTEVRIKLDIKNKKIILWDNGKGMDLDEIEEKFTNIAEGTLIPDENRIKGRKKVGLFGIGFLSTFPYCKEFQLITKKKNSNVIIKININTEKFFSGSKVFVNEEEIPYEIIKTDESEIEGETIISLIGISDSIITELSEQKWDASSIEKMGGYDRFKWTLAQYCPIEFPSEYPELREFFKVEDRVPMKLWLNSEQIFRNIPDKVQIYEQGTEKIKDIEFKYVILTPFAPVKPKEARGLQLRLRDVGIGLPTDFDIIKETGKVPGKLNYITGEIHILKGLESDLMINRDEFFITTDLQEFNSYFRKKLIKINDEFETWAKEDKKKIELLNKIPESEKVIDELYKADILHFPKERLRISNDDNIIRKKVNNPEITPELIKTQIFNDTPYQIKIKDLDITNKNVPIKVDHDEKTVFISRDLSKYQNRVALYGTEYHYSYENLSENDPICKIENNNQIKFNKAHPLFKSQLNDEIINKIALGTILISKKYEKSENILNDFIELFEEIFYRS